MAMFIRYVYSIHYVYNIQYAYADTLDITTPLLCCIFFLTFDNKFQLIPHTRSSCRCSVPLAVQHTRPRKRPFLEIFYFPRVPNHYDIFMLAHGSSSECDTLLNQRMQSVGRLNAMC